MNTLNNRNTETYRQHERGEFAASRGSAPSPRVVQWRVPVGSHALTLHFVSMTGEKLTVEDMDALAEWVALFRKAMAGGWRVERTQEAEYEI